MRKLMMAEKCDPRRAKVPIESLVPAYTLPAENRRVILKNRPAGIPQPTDFALDESAVPQPADLELLVRNIYLSVDPAQRGWAVGGANYIPAAPLGGPMAALAVGVIVKSRHQDFREGSFVYGWFGWQDYAVVGPEKVLTRIGIPRVKLSAYAGILGINGITAYLALQMFGRLTQHETVLVTTAAGAVGSTVGQLVRSAGCRAIGLTGSDDKVARCTGRFGYDAAYNYRTADIAAVLADIGAIDVFFDSIGGDVLDLALRQMNVGGRIIQCGTASIASWTPPPLGLRNEREVLTRRLSWHGFVIFDHTGKFDEAVRSLEAKIIAGDLVYDEDIEIGMDEAASAIERIYRGENQGKKLMFIG